MTYDLDYSVHNGLSGLASGKKSNADISVSACTQGDSRSAFLYPATR